MKFVSSDSAGRNLHRRDFDKATFEITSIETLLACTNRLIAITTNKKEHPFEFKQASGLLNRIKAYQYHWANKNPGMELGYKPEYIRGGLEVQDVNCETNTFIELVSRKIFQISEEILKDSKDQQKELIPIGAGLLSLLERTNELLTNRQYDHALDNLKFLRPSEDTCVDYKKLEQQIISLEKELFDRYEPSQKIIALFTTTIQQTMVDQADFLQSIGAKWDNISFEDKVTFARYYVHALCQKFDREMNAPIIQTEYDSGSALMSISPFDYKIKSPCIINIDQSNCESLSFESFIMAVTHETIHAQTIHLLNKSSDAFPDDAKWLHASLRSYLNDDTYRSQPVEKISWVFHDFIVNSCLRLQEAGIEGLNYVELPVREDPIEKPPLRRILLLKLRLPRRKLHRFE